MRKFTRLAAIAAALTVAVAAALIGIGAAFATSPSVLIILPTGMCGAPVTGPSGTQYTPNAACQITVANADDVRGFSAAGGLIAPSNITPNVLRLTDAKQVTGVPLTASGCGLSCFQPIITLGTSMELSGSSSLSPNNQQPAALWEYVVPPTYVAGQNLTVTVTAYAGGSGTLGYPRALTLNAYLESSAGLSAMGANIATSTSNPVSLTTAPVAYPFTILGTGITPGSKLLIEPITQLNESGGSSALIPKIDQVTVQ